MMETFIVSVNFATYVGADEEYTVNADSEDDAIVAALEEAKLDLDVIEVDEVDEGEYEVHVGFATFVGVEEIYTVYADSEEEAEEMALQDAEDDLSAEVVNYYD